MITKVENQLWDEILHLGYKNIEKKEFWLKLMKTGLINKCNSQELVDYVIRKEKHKEKQIIRKLKKEQRRYSKRKILDINNCSLESFNKLPGINIAIAKRLIKYRTDNSFNSVEHFWNIVNVKSHIREQIEAKYIIKIKNKRKFLSEKYDSFYVLKAVERIVDII